MDWSFLLPKGADKKGDCVYFDDASYHGRIPVAGTNAECRPDLSA
jgi:hypothetical protein